MTERKHALFLVAALVVALATASAQTTHYTTNGDFGEVFWTSGNTFGDIHVSTNKSANTLTTFLVFDLWYSSTEVVSGFGRIPNSALSGNPASVLELNVDISSFQGIIERCDYTVSPPCRPVTWSGVIRARWEKTKQESESTTFALRARLPGMILQERGTRDFTSATAGGSMFGVEFGPAFARVGTTHNVNVEIEHTSD